MENNLEYTTCIWQEDDQYIAHAMPLDVMSAGHTVEQARAALAEAIDLFLETVTENGTLTDVLYEAGYRLESGRWVSPGWIAIERHSVPLAA